VGGLGQGGREGGGEGEAAGDEEEEEEEGQGREEKASWVVVRAAHGRLLSGAERRGVPGFPWALLYSAEGVVTYSG